MSSVSYCGPFAQMTTEEFEQFYIANQSWLRAVVKSICRSNKVLVEDVISLTWMKAWEHRQQWEQRASFRTWVYKIALRAFQSEIRRMGNVVDGVWLKRTEHQLYDNVASYMDAGIAAIDCATELKQAMNRLTSMEYLFFHHLADGLSYVEIAELFDIGPYKLKTLLHRIRRILRNKPNVAAYRHKKLSADWLIPYLMKVSDHGPVDLLIPNWVLQGKFLNQVNYALLFGWGFDQEWDVRIVGRFVRVLKLGKKSFKEAVAA